MSLNEDFWDTMRTLYPHALDHFKLWINDYKRSVEWTKLFRQTIIDEKINPHPVTGFRAFREPKYHEIPDAMQFGIFLFYCQMTFDKFKIEMGNTPNCSQIDQWRYVIESVFMGHNPKIKPSELIMPDRPQATRIDELLKSDPLI